VNENTTAISVIMPAHNAARTLRVAISSTLRALPQNAELLIFLDGCSDNSEQVAKAFKDSRVKIHKSDSNVGVATALNKLLAVAQGFFIARMDADDICLPGRFRTQAREIQKSDSDFIFSNAVLFGRSVSPFGLMPQPPFALDGLEVRLALIFGNPFVHPTMFAKASSIKAMGGYRSLPAEDYDLWLRASENGLGIRKLNSFGILYRVHKAQLTQQKSWQQENAECLEVEDGRLSLAMQVLGAAGPKKLDLASLRSEVVKEVLSGTSKPIASLAKLIGLKATARAMFKMEN
jgi:glycosyltransferase involved in cell wall biosynthesis